MKRKKIHLTLAFLLAAALPAQSQMDDFVWGDPAKAAGSPNGKMTGYRFYTHLENAPGHFYHHDWMQGTIRATGGDLHEGYSLRYDAFRDELTAFNPRVNGMFVVDRQLVDGFTIEVPGAPASHFIRLTPPAGNGRDSYFEVLHEGEVRLLCRIRIVERQSGLYRNKLGKLDHRSFELQRQYYLSGRGYDFFVLEPGRKAITGLFPGRKHELRQFFRNQSHSGFREEMIPLWISRLELAGFFTGGN